MNSEEPISDETLEERQIQTASLASSPPWRSGPSDRLEHPTPISFAHLLYQTWWFRFGLAGFSGLLLIISFPPLDYGLCAWFALVPLFIAIFSSATQRWAALCGLVTGGVFYSVTLSFFLGTFGVLGLFLANTLSLYIALFAWSIWWVAARWGLSLAFALSPIFWVGIEYFRCEYRHYPLKFPWLALGYSQHSLRPLIQICEIVGVYGLSLLIISANVLFAWTILQRVRRRKWNWWTSGVALSIFGLVFIYGIFIPTRLTARQGFAGNDDRKTDGVVPVAVVQEEIGSVDQYIEWTSSAISGDLPAGGHGRETLVIWPETSLLKALATPEILSKLQALVREKKIYLVMGTLEQPSRAVLRFRNLIVIFSPEGEIIGEYAKRIPVPFVEAAVIPGKKRGFFNTRLGKIGVLICYEAGFSRLARKLVRKGAEIIVVPTSEIEGWGGWSHRLHAAMMPFRAVETGRPILRSAAAGISMIIHPSGKILATLDYQASGVLQSKINRVTQPTFYVKTGYLIPSICLIFYILWLLTEIILSVKSRAWRVKSEEESVEHEA